MNAGRDLDALVAEKVMGLAVVGWGEVTEGVVFFDQSHSDPLYLLKCECEEAKRTQALPEEWKYGHWFGCLVGVPAYSMEIDAAWALVRKLSSDGHSVLVLADASEETPHAICLAALKAVGAKVPA